MVRSKYIKTVALFASILALVVIGLGAYTRLMDAGLGCPDWPGCYGHITVTAAQRAAPAGGYAQKLVAFKAWAEMVHRYFAGSLGLLMLLLAFGLVYQGKKNQQKKPILLAFFLCLLVLYQILLGRWTVTLKLLPLIVTQHLLGGMLIIGFCWGIYYAQRCNGNQLTSAQRYYFRPWAKLGLLLLFLQLALGAWTSTHYASLSCASFPMCSMQQAFPWHVKQAFSLSAPVGINYEGGVLAEPVRQTIQMFHRSGALIVGLYLLIFNIVLIFKVSDNKLVRLCFISLGLLILQIALGIANVLYELPVAIAVSHTLCAALLFLSVISINVYLHHHGK